MSAARVRPRGAAAASSLRVSAWPFDCPRTACRQQRMLRRKDQRRRAENRVDARGEDFDRRARQSVHREIARACRAISRSSCAAWSARAPASRLRAAHDRPAIRRRMRDPQEPLLDFLRFDRRIFVPPAAAVHHLLVGQHGLRTSGTSSRGCACGRRCRARACAGKTTGSSGNIRARRWRFPAASRS